VVNTAGGEESSSRAYRTVHWRKLKPANQNKRRSGQVSKKIIGEFSFRGILQATTVVEIVSGQFAPGAKNRAAGLRGVSTWRLHDIVFANLVWCTTHTREVEGGGSYIAQ